MRSAVLILGLAILTGCAADPARDAVAPEKLFAQYWDEYLELNPLHATHAGDPRFNDRLPNYLAPAYREKQLEFAKRWRGRVGALDLASMRAADRLSTEILLRDLDRTIEGFQFPEDLVPVNQFYSPFSMLAQFGSGSTSQPFRNVKDYEDWLARGRQIGALFDQAIANMRQGVKAGVVNPRVLMEKVVPQLDALIAPEPQQTIFWQPIAKMPASFGEHDRERLTKAYAALIRDEIMPAYARLRDYIRDEYLPHTRATVGLDALPNGAAWYAYRVSLMTTTDLSPAQIHQIGLDEVARIHVEMNKVRERVKFKGDLKAFFQFVENDPQFTFKDEAALLAHYEGLRAKVDAGVPRLFSLVPRAPFEIRPVEAFRAKSAAGGSYQRPSEDGTRPGIFYVNTYDLPSRKRWDAEDLYLHEAIPGHHFQLALQQELTGLPRFRRFGSFTAFIEGWGLYAESLGRELGVYQDPYDYFGYLQNELWRSIRLVVDTGLHSKGWTRQQVIDYMLANSAEGPTNAIAEAERYMAIPGQALAYKIGELKIKALRAKAEKALGARFDPRAFHREVLEDGALPLDVLERKMDAWIARSG
jgi:uncharacterized protein (DUF885 family)